MKTNGAIVFAVLANPYVAWCDENVRQSTIDRCRAQMGDLGSSMVKFCVHEDLAAYESLQGYDDRYSEIIARCKGQMLALTGWATVKFCADEEIEAERALEEY